MRSDVYKRQGYTTTKEETLAMEVPYNAQLTPYLKVEAPAGLEIDMRTDNYACLLYTSRCV